MTSRSHYYDRPEWVEAFIEAVMKNGACDRTVAEAELESWPIHEGDWEEFSPEDAALESLSYWEE